MIRLGEIWRTSTFRFACLSSGIFASLLVILCGIIYWQAAIYETKEIDGFIVQEARRIASGDAGPMVEALVRQVDNRPGRRAYSALFTTDFNLVVGNLTEMPLGLAIDGSAHRAVAIDRSSGIAAEHSLRAVAIALPDHQVLVIGRSVWQLEDLENALLRTLAVGAVPALLISLVAGVFLSRRALQRVRHVRRRITQIIAGDLRERLPLQGTQDDFDRLAHSINLMLDEIEMLLGEIRGVGGDIAHDLRTPLTRVRTRLERAREAADTGEHLEEAIDNAISGLDQALTIITALLRITELEDGRRRAGFGSVDLAAIIQDVVELYVPIAEATEVDLGTRIETRGFVVGDRELLIEALANIVDNAIKFTPRHGRVEVALVGDPSRPAVRVADTGPGIPVGERESVMRRFYRSDKSRHLPGSGLGLGLVGAITKLHNFRVTIGDANPGCVFSVACFPETSDAVADLANGLSRPHPSASD
jgi:signal transduction histidine kinase